MNIPELKKSVEYWNYKLSREHRDVTISIEMEEQLIPILSACQLLCDVSDKMEPKKDIAVNYTHPIAKQRQEDFDNGYNLAREEDILWLSKKMMGIENMLKNYQGIELHIATGKGFKDLANAIIQSFGLKMEG